MKRVEKIPLEAMNNITSENWQKCIKHTMRIEDDYVKRDVAVNHLMEDFTINIGPDESSDEEDDITE